MTAQVEELREQLELTPKEQKLLDGMRIHFANNETKTITLTDLRKVFGPLSDQNFNRCARVLRAENHITHVKGASWRLVPPPKVRLAVAPPPAEDAPLAAEDAPPPLPAPKNARTPGTNAHALWQALLLIGAEGATSREIFELAGVGTYGSTQTLLASFQNQGRISKIETRPRQGKTPPLYKYVLNRTLGPTLTPKPRPGARKHPLPESEPPVLATMSTNGQTTPNPSTNGQALPARIFTDGDDVLPPQAKPSSMPTLQFLRQQRDDEQPHITAMRARIREISELVASVEPLLNERKKLVDFVNELTGGTRRVGEQ
ncbi:MAG: hypothetical protein NVSMB5_22550 [Candidatus Velthaea sp.]